MKIVNCSIEFESITINDVVSTIDPPLSLEEFSSEIDLLREHSEELGEQQIKELGGRLFQRVFTEAALDQYRSTDPVAVALVLNDDLTLLPWELLHDGANWVARTRGVVRIASTEQRPPKIYPKSGALHILAAIAGPLLHYDESLPDDHPHQPYPIDVNAHAEVFRKLEEAQFPAEIKLLKHITREILSREMSESHHVLHFVGHGGVGKLMFENRYGITDSADEDWIREQITVGLRGNLRLVVINSCFSADAGDEATGVANTILEAGVPSVIAMQGSISEAADIAFMKNLYSGLGKGKPIDEAVMDARRAMAADWQIGTWEWATPVLFVNESLLEAGESLNLMDAGMAAMINDPKVKIVEPSKASPDPMMARDERFAGRRRELNSILKSLDPENRDGVQTVCLHGDAGMGKTAIAIEAAHRMAEWFDDVVWLSGRAVPPDELKEYAKSDDPLTRITSAEGFVTTLAHKCGVELNGNEDQSQLRDVILSGLRGDRRRLLVLDGVEPFVGSDLIRSLLTNLPANCKALITSVESLEVNERQIHVDPMNSRDSAQLLSAYSALKDLKTDSERTSEIIHVTGGNPMVMRLVVSQVTSSEKTLDDALEDLRKAEGIVFDHVFSHSLTLAESGGRKIFAAMAVFFPTASRKALQSACGLSDLDFEKAIESIVGLSLVESYEQGKRFSLHQLARIKAQQQLEGDTERQGYRERAAQFFIELVNATAPMTRPEVAVKALGAPKLEGISAQRIQDAAVEIFVRPAIDLLEMELFNCFLTMDWLLDKDDVDAANGILANLSDFLTKRGYWSEAIYFLTRVADSLKKHGKDYAEAAVLLGVLHERQGKWKESVSYYESALESARESQNKELEANILNGLGTIYAGQGDWSHASEYLEPSLEAFHQLGDEEGEALASSALGGIYQQTDRWDEATRRFENSLEIFRRRNNKLGAADSLDKLAECCQHSEEYEKAVGYCDESLSIYVDLEDKNGQGNILNNLGMLYYKQGDLDQAIQSYHRALEIKNEAGDVVGKQVILDNLALVHSARAEWMQVASACLESFQIAVQVHSGVVIDSLRNILEVTRNIFDGKEFAIPAQLAQQITELIKNTEPIDDEIPAALAICHGVFTIIGFMAACECDKESDAYKEALELARSLDERTGVALELVEWLE